MRENYDGITLGLNGKILLMASIFLFFLLMFMPLWQIGVHHSLEEAQVREERMIQALGEEERALRTELATLRQSERETMILAALPEFEQDRVASAR